LGQCLCLRGNRGKTKPDKLQHGCGRRERTLHSVWY